MRYFDTSFLVPLFMDEAASDLVVDYFSALSPNECATSQWTRLEFGSLIGIRVRRKQLDAEQAQRVERSLDSFLASFTMLEVEPPEIDLASAMMREHSVGLRAGDALHLATASNRAISPFLSLDKAVIRAGRHFGIDATAAIPLAGYEQLQ